MRTAYALLGLALFFTAPARAQDLSVPSNWRVRAVQSVLADVMMSSDYRPVPRSSARAQ
jgi:hypothetical protein